MELIEIRKRKDALDIKINELIRGFTIETSVQIADLDIHRTETLGASKQIFIRTVAII